MTQIDIADLDCIFLTYAEPQKEEFWIRVRNIVPWAKRVDGVKGSDAAHKAAAQASDTERFILIDGDNIPDQDFFNKTLILDDTNKDCVFRWKACNVINNLRYGNGGLSCWTKTFVNNMRTHENSDGTAENDVEFCFYPNYWAMHDCFSTTFPNQSEFHAWRAGFREGVKMCLNRGARPTLQEFQHRVHQRNLDHLTIWHNIGRDVEHGIWAIVGARMGTYMTMLTEWDHKLVQDFDELKKLWDQYHDKIMDTGTWQVSRDLKTRLGLPIVEFNEEQSKFFKHHYKHGYKNIGTTISEMDVIRKQEGW